MQIIRVNNLRLHKYRKHETIDSRYIDCSMQRSEFVTEFYAKNHFLFKTLLNLSEQHRTK